MTLWSIQKSSQLLRAYFRGNHRELCVFSVWSVAFLERVDYPLSSSMSHTVQPWCLNVCAHLDVYTLGIASLATIRTVLTGNVCSSVGRAQTLRIWDWSIYTRKIRPPPRNISKCPSATELQTQSWIDFVLCHVSNSQRGSYISFLLFLPRSWLTKDTNHWQAY